MGNDNLSDAVAALAAEFLSAAARSDDFAAFEARSVDIGFEAIREAMSAALAAYDDELHANAVPAGATVHDRKPRELLTEVGVVSFSRRAYRGANGRQFCLLDHVLSVPAGRRLSPGAFSMVRDDALCGSYANAAEVLCRHSGTKLSRTAVMGVVREAAEAAAADDGAARESLFSDGLLPAGARVAGELCVEADGTWVALQRDAMRKAELKVVTAYAGKEPRGGGRRRVGAVHTAVAGSPADAWETAVARIGAAYDLSSVATVHLGTDGGAWCKAGGAYFPGCDVVGHLDPWHLNKAIARSAGPAARGVAASCAAGDVAGALETLGSLPDPDGKVAELRRYIAGNADIIGVPGPALGTVECDNSVVYKSRLSGRRAWSRAGMSAMARLLARKATGEALPGMRAACHEAVWEIPRGLRASEVVQSVGSGYEPPSAHFDSRNANDRGFADWVVNGNWR